MKDGTPRLTTDDILIFKLAEVLSSGRKQFRPFRYMPQAFDAREDELLVTKRFGIYDEMYRDPVVKSAIKAKTAGVIQGYSIQPADAKEGLSLLAMSLCMDAVKAMKGGFVKSLRRQIAKALQYGFSVQDPEWQVVTSGKWAGMETIRQLHWRLPHFLEPVRDDEEDEVVILQKDPNAANGLPNKAFARDLVYYVWQGELDPYKGEADSRAAYNRWWMKDTLVKLMAIHMEAMATGKPTVKFDPSLMGGKVSPQLVAEAKRIVEHWNEMSAAVILPGLIVDVVQGEASADHYIQVINWLNDEIRTAIGSAKLLTEQSGETGSYALAQAQGDFQASQQGGELQLDIEELVREQIFLPILRRNGIPEEYCPVFSLTPPQAKDRKAQAELYFQGLTNGAIQKREKDEDWLRSIMEAPSVEEAGKLTAEKIVEQGAASGAQFSRRDYQPSYGMGRASEALGVLLAGRFGFMPPATRSSPPKVQRFAKEDVPSDTVWVGVPVPAEAASILAIPGGEAPETLHITVAYPGKREQLPEVDPLWVRKAIGEVCSGVAPFWGRASGLLRFAASPTSDGKDCVCAAVDAPGLVQFRQTLVRALAAIGLPPRPEHDFQAHITLAYIDPDSSSPVERLEPISFLLDRVQLNLFGVVEEFRFIGSSVATYAREVSNPWPKLDALALQADAEIGQALAQELWKLLSAAEATFLDDSLDPAEKLAAAQGFTFDPGKVASVAASWLKDAWAIGETSAAEEIPSIGRYASGPVNPGGLEGFKSLWALLKSKLTTTAAGLASEVNSSLLRIIEAAYKSKESWTETRAKLVNMLFDTTGIRLSSVRPDPSAVFPSPASLQRQTREAFAESADRARFEAYQRNPDFIAGYERDEVMGGNEPGRSHPLSKYVHGLRIPMDHPLADKFVGVLHYNDRGGIRNISRLKANRPDFKGWSTDAQIRAAYLKMQTLSPAFA